MASAGTRRGTPTNRLNRHVRTFSTLRTGVPVVLLTVARIRGKLDRPWRTRSGTASACRSCGGVQRGLASMALALGRAAGSALGSKSASAGVVLRRFALLSVGRSRWSRRIRAGQRKCLGFMACKRSAVRARLAPQEISGQTLVLELSGFLSRSSDRHLTVGLSPDRWHATAWTGLR